MEGAPPSPRRNIPDQPTNRNQRQPTSTNVNANPDTIEKTRATAATVTRVFSMLSLLRYLCVRYATFAIPATITAPPKLGNLASRLDCLNQPTLRDQEHTTQALTCAALVGVLPDHEVEVRRI